MAGAMVAQSVEQVIRELRGPAVTKLVERQHPLGTLPLAGGEYCPEEGLEGGKFLVGLGLLEGATSPGGRLGIKGGHHLPEAGIIGHDAVDPKLGLRLEEPTNKVLLLEGRQLDADRLD